MDEPRRRPLRAKLALGCGSVLFGLVLAEAALRIVLPVHPKGWFVRVPDDDIYYVPAPGISYTLDGLTYTHNRDGMRCLRDFTPRDGKPRVAFIGDSIAYGCGVDDGETACDRLSALLPVEGLDFGVPGYNAHQAVATVPARVARFDDVRAVVYLMHENDLVNATFSTAYLKLPWRLYSRYEKPTGTLRFYAKCSYLVHFAYQTIDAARASEAAPGPRRFTKPTDYAPPFDLYRSLALSPSHHRALFAEDLERLAAECKKLGAAPVLVYVPSRYSFFLDAKDELAGAVRALCEPAGVSFIDGRAALGKGDDVELYADEGHPNAEGHRRLAVAIAAELSRRGLK